MEEYSWEIFDDVFGLPKSFSSLSEEFKEYNLEVTLNYPKTAEYERMTEEVKKMLYNELFIDLINEVHRITNTVTQTNYVYEKGDCTKKLHIHGVIGYLHKSGSSIYGLLEQTMKYMLSKVRPGRNRENTWEKVVHYPYPCLSCPFICLSIGPKEKGENWTDYLYKDQKKKLE